MAQKARRGKSLARRRGRAIIVVVAVALALAFLGARLFRVYQPRAGNPSPEASLKPVDSIHYQFSDNHIHGLGYDSRNQRLFVATHYGIFIWKDGKLFQMGESRDDYMGFSLHPSDPNTIYTSGHPQKGGNLGVMKSEDGGLSFTQIFRGPRGEALDFHSMTISPANPQVLYGAYHGRLYRTRDGGRSWEVASATGLPQQGFCFGAPCLAADSGDERVAYAGTPAGLLVSRDFGESWTAMSPQLGAVAGIGVESATSHRFFAFSEKLGVAFSDDGGKSWVARSKGIELSRRDFVFAFHFNPKSAGEVFAATPERIFRTGNEGQNWNRIL
jgi:photosystem II stability/assembly factor-like uncharacterized protein